MYTLDITRLLLLALAGFVALVYVWPGIRRWHGRHAVTVYAFGVGIAFLFTVLFHGTPFGLNSYFGDQHYILAAITKYRYTASWVDFSYAHLVSYYPPLYFYVLGRAAWLLHIPAYHMFKLGFLFVALVGPAVLFHVWSPLIGKRAALLLTVLLFLMFPQELLYKTYEFLTAAVVLPWWLIFGEGRIEWLWQSRRRRILSFAVGGILGAVIFQTYYYWFFLIVVYLAVSFILNVIFGHETVRASLCNTWRKVGLLALVVLFSAYYWLPLVCQLVTVGYQNYQNRWLSRSMMNIDVFYQLSGLDLVSLLLLIGFVYLLVAYGRTAIARILLQFTLACFVWYLIGFVGVLVGTPNLSIKAWMFNNYLLLAGAVLCFDAFCQSDRLRPYATRIFTFALCLVILVMGQTDVDNISGQVKSDTGRLYQTSFAHHTPPSSVRQLATLSNLNGKVFLTDHYAAIDFTPIDLFIGYNLNYANPAARYGDRARFVSALSHVTDADALSWLLQYNEFDRVDDVWMNKPYLVVSSDAYPNGTAYHHVPVPTIYRHSSAFSKVGGTDIYHVNDVAQGAYTRFHLYGLAVASVYARQPLRGGATALLEARIASTSHAQALRALLPVVSGDASLYKAVEVRLAQLCAIASPSSEVVFQPTLCQNVQ